MICVKCFLKDNDNHPGDKFGRYLNICARDLQQAANPQSRLHLQAQQVRKCTRWQIVLHLEKSELLLGQRPDRARDERAL